MQFAGFPFQVSFEDTALNQDNIQNNEQNLNNNAPQYRDFTQILTNFIQQQSPNFEIYKIYFKPKKGQSILIFSQSKVLDLFVWNEFVTIDEINKKISIKAVLSYTNGQYYQVESHTSRQLISKYFIKLNSTLRQGNFSCHPQSGEIQLKMNSFMTKQNYENVTQQLSNVVESKQYQNLYTYLRQTFFSSNLVLKEHSLKLITLLNQISEQLNEYILEFQQNGKKNFSLKQNNKEAKRRLDQVRENLLKSSEYRHNKDPKSDFALNGQAISDSEENEYFKPYKQLNSQGLSQDIYSKINIQKDGCKIEENFMAGGGFAEIFRATLTVVLDNKQEMKRKFAIKREKNKEGRASHEKLILEQLKGKNWPYIAKFFETDYDELKKDLIMEYYPHKSLDHFKMNFSVSLSLSTKLYILWQILQGIRFLKDNQISHLDLKPANILIGKSLQAKITDFGESYNTKVCDANFKPGRTVPYVPPEILKKIPDFGQGHDRIDVFSFGVIMSDVLFDEYPMVLKRGQQEKIQLRYKQKKIDRKEQRDFCFITDLNANKKEQESQESKRNGKQENTYYYRLLDNYKSQQGPKHCMKLILSIIFKCIEDPNQRPYLEYLVIMLKDIQVYLEKITQ